MVRSINLNFCDISEEHVRKSENDVNQKMENRRTGGALGLLQVFLAVTMIELCDPCKYPNLNMKFDIRKIVERK